MKVTLGRDLHSLLLAGALPGVKGSLLEVAQENSVKQIRCVCVCLNVPFFFFFQAPFIFIFEMPKDWRDLGHCYSLKLMFYDSKL